MSQTVEVPEIGKVRFPDRLPPEEIQKIIETEIIPDKKIDDVESGLIQGSIRGAEHIIKVYPLAESLVSFVTGIFGFIVSFFAKDPELAATVRSRCLIGMAIGVVMVIAWKIYQSRE